MWNQKWNQVMKTLGFVALQSDQCVFAEMTQGSYSMSMTNWG